MDGGIYQPGWCVLFENVGAGTGKTKNGKPPRGGFPFFFVFALFSLQCRSFCLSYYPLRCFKDTGIFEMDYAAVRAWLNVFVGDFTVCEFVCSEIVAYGLLVDVQFFGNFADAAGGQFVLDCPQFLECNIHS